MIVTSVVPFTRLKTDLLPCCKLPITKPLSRQALLSLTAHGATETIMGTAKTGEHRGKFDLAGMWRITKEMGERIRRLLGELHAQRASLVKLLGRVEWQPGAVN